MVRLYTIKQLYDEIYKIDLKRGQIMYLRWRTMLQIKEIIKFMISFTKIYGMK
jgi:hypothetical protein